MALRTFLFVFLTTLSAQAAIKNCELDVSLDTEIAKSKAQAEQPGRVLGTLKAADKVYDWEVIQDEATGFYFTLKRGQKIVAFTKVWYPFESFPKNPYISMMTLASDEPFKLVRMNCN